MRLALHPNSLFMRLSHRVLVHHCFLDLHAPILRGMPDLHACLSEGLLHSLMWGHAGAAAEVLFVGKDWHIHQARRPHGYYQAL